MSGGTEPAIGWGESQVLIDGATVGLQWMSAPALSSEGDVAYLGGAGASWGVYRNHILFDEMDAATGLGPGRPAISGGGAVAFERAYGSPTAELQVIRMTDAAQRSVLADTAAGDFRRHWSGTTSTSMVPYMVAATGSPAHASGCVVFQGAKVDDGADALFIADEDGVQIVAEELVQVEGQPVFTIQAGYHALNHRGQVAFWAQLGDRIAIVRADPTDLEGPRDEPDQPRDPEDQDPGAPSCGCGHGDAVALAYLLPVAFRRRAKS